MAAPKLRFKNAEGAEFTSWVTSFIGDECKITTGNKDTQNKIDGGKYPFFVRSQTVERINTYSKDCEAILTSGDGVGVGKNYHYINGKFDVHQRVYCLYDFSNQLLGKYLYIYFSNYFFDRVKRLSAKNSVDSVRMDMISKMEIKLPSLVEQTKIASFLTAVDEKISQLSQKHQLLSQYKQGMMQKLFSQQIRFKADDGSEFGAWESKKLNEIGQSFNGLVGKSKEDFGEGEAYITYKQIFDHRKINLNNVNFVNIQPNDTQNMVKKGDLFFTTSSETADEVAYCSAILDDFEFPLYLNSFCFGYRPNSANILNSAYASFYFRSEIFRNKINHLAQGSTRFNISKTAFMNVVIHLPMLEEQTKIANFLSAIDQKIDVVSEQLEQAKLWKKGLLQQMFV